MPKVKSEARNIAELRARHAYCVTPYEIQQAYLRSPDYQMETPLEFRSRTTGKVREVRGHCDFPEDPICASLAVREETIKEALENVERDTGVSLASS